MCSKAEGVLAELSSLLEASAIDDDHRWGAVWKLVPHNQHDAKLLILDLVLTSLAAWTMRFLRLASEFPHVLLKAVVQHHDVDCPRRRALAAALLHGCEACLLRDAGDFAVKIRKLFFEDFTIMANTGKCTIMLYMVLLVLRCTMQAETQQIDGWNSLVQSMCKRSPNMHWPLTNSRMNLKLSPAISAASCAAVVDQVEKYMKTPGYAVRFQPLSADNLVGLPCEAEPPPPCFHAFSERIVLLSSALAYRIQARIDSSCKYVYEVFSFGGLELEDTTLFLTSWSYNRMPHCFVGSKLVEDGGSEIFELPLELVPRKLALLLSTTYQGLIDNEILDAGAKVQSCKVRKYVAFWQPAKLKVATLQLAEEIDVEIKVVPRKRKPRPGWPRGPRPDAELLVAVLQDDAAAPQVGADFDLEADLEELLARELGPGGEAGDGDEQLVDAGEAPEGEGEDEGDDFGVDAHDADEVALAGGDGAEDSVPDGAEDRVPDGAGDRVPDHFLGGVAADVLEALLASLYARRFDSVEAIRVAKEKAAEHNELEPTAGSICRACQLVVRSLGCVCRAVCSCCAARREQPHRVQCAVLGSYSAFPRLGHGALGQTAARPHVEGYEAFSHADGVMGIASARTRAGTIIFWTAA